MNNPVTFQEAFRRVVDDLGELMFKKQHDYGPGNILAFGELGVLVRLNDKLERLKNLYRKGVEPANESVEDTWRDIANYAIIALLLRRGWFTLPLGDKGCVPSGQEKPRLHGMTKVIYDLYEAEKIGGTA